VDAEPSSSAAGDPRRDREHRHSVSLLLVLTLLVATAVVAGSIIASFAWSSARARDDARRDARYQAQLAGDGLEASIAKSSSALSAAAAAPGVRAAVTGPAGCRLSDDGVHRYPGTHIDLVLPDGTVQCSSLPADAITRPGGSTAWLARAAGSAAAGVSPVLADSASGAPSVVAAAPVLQGGRPVATLGAVVPIAGFADGLARSYAGPRDFSFAIVDSDTGALLSASGVARPQADRTWEANAGDAHGGSWTGSDGRDAIFGSAPVPQLGWRIYAGLDAATVTAAARGAMVRQGQLGCIALLALAGLALLVSRRIVRPLQSVTDAVVSARDTAIPAPLEVTGPKEIATLASEFNAMIEARLDYEARLAQRALHDDLTGLPNRSLLRDRLERALTPSPGHPAAAAVLFLDLDRFKLVNDGLGHPAGDALLQAVAGRLADVVDAPDTLARFGGDEFVIVCEDTTSAEAVERARRVIAALDSPFVIAGGAVNITARIGIAVGHGSTSDPDELVREADIAMYHAKHTGNAWELWGEELRARSEHRLELTHDLRSAVANGELMVAYQPIFDLEEWRVVGAEALVRWHHPRLGLLAPGRFIGLAEDSGQIAAVGHHVLERACATASRLNRRHGDFSVSVNLAEAQLDDALAPSVQQVLDGTGLDPARLCLELTESSLVSAFGNGADALTRLRAMDIHIAVDDFGTGYSSLSYLQQFPFDTLKIDRTFVQPLGSGDPRSGALIQAILSVATAFELRVIAEGVETPEQLGELRRLGCPYVQGFLLSRPVPAEVLETLTRQAAPTTV
jgi:diguanylate cyclase (GGDEF)-like protein